LKSYFVTNILVSIPVAVVEYVPTVLAHGNIFIRLPLRQEKTIGKIKICYVHAIMHPMSLVAHVAEGLNE
jgi:hypothetical protein